MTTWLNIYLLVDPVVLMHYLYGEGLCSQTRVHSSNSRTLLVIDFNNIEYTIEYSISYITSK